MGTEKEVDTVGEMVGETTTSRLDRLAPEGSVTTARRESLQVAIDLGADEATLVLLRDAVRLARKDTIVLPPGKYEHLSRGRGWARKGKGDSAEWGEKEDDGYRVGPGRWSVGSNDGFNRKSDVSWVVKHIAVGPQTWTVAS